MPFTAVILAGGRSSRMGRDKAFVPFQGKPLIEHAVQRVREAGAREVLLSGRPEQDFSGCDCPVLLDLTPDCGPLGGIERGLDAAVHSKVLVLAVDLPNMTAECLRWLLSEGSAQAIGSGRRSARIVPLPGQLRRASAAPEVVGAVPVHNGRLQPLAACYPKSAHALVAALLREQRHAARELAARCVQGGLVNTLEVPGEHEACFANWNTPDDVTT